MKSKEGVKIIKEKSATAQQRFTWFLVTDQESNLFLARAVAFLMFMFPCSLYDTDKRYDDTDDRNNNTDNAYHCFQHLMSFNRFPICITSNNTGSSQNVSTLAKGEPLTVLVTLHFYYKR